MCAQAALRHDDQGMERYSLHPAPFQARGKERQVGSQNVEKIFEGHSPRFREEPGQDASARWASPIMGWQALSKVRERYYVQASKRRQVTASLQRKEVSCVHQPSPSSPSLHGRSWRWMCVLANTSSAPVLEAQQHFTCSYP